MNGLSATHHLFAALLKIGMLLSLLFGFAHFSHAQTEDSVHIVPQYHPASPHRSKDPALREHAKLFKADVNLVLVPVLVTDQDDRAVTGLDKGNFVIYENGRKQAIQSFSSEDAPVSIGIIFDMSKSMTEKLKISKEAVVQFLRISNPDDEFFVIGVSDRPELITDFTTSLGDVQNTLALAFAQGKTALLDSIYLGLQEMRRATLQRKALLIISDGGDNHSRYTDNEIKDYVKEADAQIYSIGIFDSKPKTAEEVEGPGLLADISSTTGGRLFTVGDPRELSDIVTKIGEELRTEYVIGYRPSNSPVDGKWRKIKVKLTLPKGVPRLTLSAKKGYYAQSQ